MKSAKYITLYVFCLDFIVINEAAVIDSKCALLKLTVEGGGWRYAIQNNLLAASLASIVLHLTNETKYSKQYSNTLCYRDSQGKRACTKGIRATSGKHVPSSTGTPANTNKLSQQPS